MYQRRQSRQVMIGDVAVGGQAPISVQSMTNTDTRDLEATVTQIHRLEDADCEIIRVGVPDLEAARALAGIKSRISLPLVADIHFDYRLALEAIDGGVDALRLNPGNIDQKQHLKQVVARARKAGIPIRIGVNSGSIPGDLLEEYGHPTARAMVEAAIRHIDILEAYGFNDIIISLKSTSVSMTLEAYKLMADRVDYPFHIGITEAGPPRAGTIKSAAGLGSLLTSGLGDTLRVSLTGDPVTEVEVGWEILKSLDLREHGPRIISCPTCARSRINVIRLASEVEEAVRGMNKSLSIAIMGCAVNGPGEAREADIGIAGGKQEALIFKKGKPLRKVEESRVVEELLTEIEKM